jgi:hypothetical protein
MEPRNRCQGINSASLCSLAGWYDNPIPTRCLAPIDFLKILALIKQLVWYSGRRAWAACWTGGPLTWGTATSPASPPTSASTAASLTLGPSPHTPSRYEYRAMLPFCAVLWIRIRKILGTSCFHLYYIVTFNRTIHKWTPVLWIWIRSDRYHIAALDFRFKRTEILKGYGEPVKISHGAPFIILRFYVRLPDPSSFVKILIRIKQKK